MSAITMQKRIPITSDLRWVLLGVLATLALAARTEAATLYGSTASGGPGELYILNPATGGIVQDIGPLNNSLGQNFAVTGLAFNPLNGVLYGSTANSSGQSLLTINPASGLVTVVGAFNTGIAGNTMADIAFDTSGHLFGIGSSANSALFSINLSSGQATIIGSSGVTGTSGGGLAISTGGIFYGTPVGTNFGTYNPTTGAFANIANPAKPAGGGAYAALDFDDSGILYGLNSGPGAPPPTHLVTINPANGAVTDIGSSVDALDAIAFQPVPEPGTMALLIGSGVMGVLIKARRRK